MTSTKAVKTKPDPVKKWLTNADMYTTRIKSVGYDLSGIVAAIGADQTCILVDIIKAEMSRKQAKPALSPADAHKFMVDAAARMLNQPILTARA